MKQKFKRDFGSFRREYNAEQICPFVNGIKESEYGKTELFAVKILVKISLKVWICRALRLDFRIIVYSTKKINKKF